jgi:AAA15 family ATPase/GTPase
MLLRFSAANHLSIRDRQELSLAASSRKDTEEGLINCTFVQSGRLLPTAIIYGANASGKSNFITALKYMCGAVRFSHSKGEPGKGVPRNPFKLDPTCAKAPSTFDADFVVDGVRYHYGFKASDKALDAEWLYSFSKNRRQMLFERTSKGFEFGRGLRGRNRVISDLTRPNSLFLSAAIQNGHQQLSKVGVFFQSLHVDTPTSTTEEMLSWQLAKDGIDKRTIKFLTNIGTGVVNYRLQKSKHGKDFVKYIKENLDLDPESYVELAHTGRNNKEVYFSIGEESAGTQRLLPLLDMVFRALDEGAVLVIDELDAHLHTQACEAVMELFSSPMTNPNGAQLIATTHDTNLLRSALLRRDQVWFTEKDAKGATHLYPLTDIRTRKGDNIAKGYLQGRYGAIPFSGSISNLFAAD